MQRNHEDSGVRSTVPKQRVILLETVPIGLLRFMLKWKQLQLKTLSFHAWGLCCWYIDFIMNPEEDRSRGCSSYDYLGDVEGHIFLDPSPLCIKKTTSWACHHSKVQWFETPLPKEKK